MDSLSCYIHEHELQYLDNELNGLDSFAHLPIQPTVERYIPIKGKKVPIYIADFVLANYGTGMVMAVPTHDQRDYDFAKKFDLPIIQVLESNDPNFDLFRY